MESDVKNLLECLLTERVLRRAGILRGNWLRDWKDAHDGMPAPPEETPPWRHFVTKATTEITTFREQVITELTPTPLSS